MNFLLKLIEELFVGLIASVIPSYTGGGIYVTLAGATITIGIFIIRHFGGRRSISYNELPSSSHGVVSQTNYTPSKEPKRTKETFKSKIIRTVKALVASAFVVLFIVGGMVIYLMATKGQDSDPREILMKVNALSIENKELKEMSGKEFAAEISAKRTFVREQAIDVMNSKLRGVLKNKGEYLYDTAKKYEVNPLFIAAKFVWESANGTSNVICSYNNPSGINWNGQKRYIQKGYKCRGTKPLLYVGFPSLDIGIEESIILLKNNYIDDGRIDVKSIGARWAPGNDPRNGMHGMDNNAWVSNVSHNYIEMKKEYEKRI